MPRDVKTAVERLKNRLYSRGVKTDTGEERTPLSPDTAQAPTSWGDVVPPPPATSSLKSQASEQSTTMASHKKKVGSLSKKFFFGSLVFFLGASGIAAYMFFGGGNLISPQNISIEVVAPSLIDGGKAATFQVLISNHNQAPLTLADLVIDYPDGTRVPANTAQSLTHERQSIGTIASGEQITKTISGVFYGKEGTQETVHVVLEYSVAGSNAVFEKPADVTFTIGSSPVSVSVDAPSEAIAGEPFTMSVEVRSNATTPVENAAVQIQYPFGYTFVSADPAPEGGSTLWQLGTMKPGTTKTIKLTGTLDGQDGDQRVFRISTGSNADQTDTSIRVPFVVVPQALTVRRPFITGSISVNGQSGKTITINQGQAVQGTITWQNNLSDVVSDLQISLSLAGPALDQGSISASDGFYQSSNNSIIWSKDQDSSLASVPPGGSGTLQFSFNTLPAASNGVLITNPTVTLNVTVQGNRLNESNVPEKISSAASTKVVLASAASVSTQTLHFTGPFTNGGPVPPHAEQATLYTVLWSVKNSSNTLANAVVSATLPSYVEFAQTQQGLGVSYDKSSRTVSWNLGDLKAGVGYSGAARQAAFQVTLIPSTSQIGASPQLTGPTQLSGQDRFAQVNVQASAEAPTTDLAGEGHAGVGIVAPK